MIFDNAEGVWGVPGKFHGEMGSQEKQEMDGGRGGDGGGSTMDDDGASAVEEGGALGARPLPSASAWRPGGLFEEGGLL